MPKSRIRKKKVYGSPTEAGSTTPSSHHKPSPRWIPGLALGLALAGMIWLVTYYMTGTAYPIASLGPWNIAVGFGGIVVALGVLTQWR